MLEFGRQIRQSNSLPGAEEASSRMRQVEVLFVFSEYLDDFSIRTISKSTDPNRTVLLDSDPTHDSAAFDLSLHTSYH